MAGAPSLVRAGSTFLTLSWTAPSAPVSIKLEFRRPAWLFSASWIQQDGSPENLHIAENVAECTLNGLDPATSFEVRMTAELVDGTTQASEPATFATLALAPPLSVPPGVRCSRHDRLLLHWVGPASHTGEVIAYKVRYYDCDRAWPVKNEVEAKLASWLLKPSEQTTLFLGGDAAMRVPRGRGNSGVSEDPVKEGEEDDGLEVHFWLTNLAPSSLYILQVAAVTAGGQGEWSPKSQPLSTWRVAPALLAPVILLATHASILIGVACEPLGDGVTGQDEEVDKFEVTVIPSQKGEELHRAIGDKDKASELAATYRTVASEEERAAANGCAYMLAMHGLSPKSTYSCQVRALSRAGVGELSPLTQVETLAVSPIVNDVRAVAMGHDAVAVLWSVAHPFSQDLLDTCMGKESTDELSARQLRGFKVALAEKQPKSWHEVLSVRAGRKSPGETWKIEIPNLQPSTTYFVRVAAVSVGSEICAWSNHVEVTSEDLAPAPIAAPEVEAVSRRGSRIRWTIPDDTCSALVTGYILNVCKKQDRGRAGSMQQHDIDLLENLKAPDGDQELAIWRDGGVTKATLGPLEPGTQYVVQVTARTSRGIGANISECLVTTRARAPDIAKGPELLQAYYNRLFLESAGPVADWGENGCSDVTGYRVRYFECARFTPHGAWVEADVDATPVSSENSSAVRFWLEGLAPERQYVIQLAACTAAGKGPWSAQSDRLGTCRVAPDLLSPRLLFRTHTCFAIGWSLVPLSEDQRATVHDEVVSEFVIRVTSTSSRGDARCMNTTCTEAAELSLVWGESIAGSGPAEDSVEGESQWPTCLIPATSEEQHPEFITVITGLTPSLCYTCTVSAVSSAGEGRPSAASAEMGSLALAPQVSGMLVDDVQYNQIQVSWPLPHFSQPLPLALTDRLGLTASVAELELRRCAVRFAPQSWRGPSWREPVAEEIDEQRSDKCVRLTVKDLKEETAYILEARADSVAGAGDWCRVGDGPICTAIVAPEPPAPELVYLTSRALTFAFAGVEDSRVVGYEVRRFEGWAGAWGRPSKPLRFGPTSVGVRVTAEGRWVVSMNELQPNTSYALQLRGVTEAKSVTKWSARSQPMCTPSSDDMEVVDAGIGVNEGNPTTTRSISATSSTAPAAGDVVDEVAKKIEDVLAFMINYACAGVPLPSAGIPAIAEQSDELLRQNQGNKSAALSAAAKMEDDESWRTKLPDFLIRQVPVVGCSTLFLRELWRSMRRCALIAHLYGHDTAKADTQARILTCLVPTGSGGSVGTMDPEEAVSNSRRVALLVSRALAKETLVRATGLKRAGQVIDLLGVAGDVLKANSAPAEGGAGDGATSSSCSAGGPMADDVDQPSPSRVALELFRPPGLEERRRIIVVYFFFWLLPIFVSAVRFVAARLWPLLLVQMELPLAGIAAAMLVALIGGILVALWVQQNFQNFLHLPATVVFVLYTILPALSVFLAMRSVLQGAAEAPYFVLLGLYNLGSGFVRWSTDISDDATFEGTGPRFVQGREHVKAAQKCLWVVLVLDFVIEELFGRQFRLHSFRLLGPSPQQAGASLTEYRTAAFAMGLLSAWSQTHVLELLKRRTVLLRLLGARNAIIGGLSLLLMGAFAVAQLPIVAFLREVSPTPWWCCMVLWLRQWGAIVGAVLPLSLHVLLQPQYLGFLDKDKLVPLAVGLGVVLGHMFSISFTTLWYDRREQLESGQRVLFLLPHISAQARAKASDAMRVVLKRQLQATKNTAVEWATSRMVRSIWNVSMRYLAGNSVTASK